MHTGGKGIYRLDLRGQRKEILRRVPQKEEEYEQRISEDVRSEGP